MKKLLSIALAAMLVTSLVSSALAHGGHRGGAQRWRYPVCAIESCTLTGVHAHGGRVRTAHYYGDGHDYHDYCGVDDCTQLDYHAHGDAYCFGGAQSAGYRNVRRGCC